MRLSKIHPLYVPFHVFQNPGLEVGPPFKITLQAQIKALDFITNHSVESGGILLGDYNQDGVDHFEPDYIGSRQASSTVYSPHHRSLNITLERFRRKGKEIKGILHTHPGDDAAFPSPEVTLGQGDIGYARKFFIENESALYLLFPILTYCRNRLTISPYMFRRNKKDGMPDLLYAPLQVMDASSFGEWNYNPAWLASLETEHESTKTPNSTNHN